MAGTTLPAGNQPAAHRVGRIEWSGSYDDILNQFSYSLVNLTLWVPSSDCRVFYSPDLQTGTAFVPGTTKHPAKNVLASIRTFSHPFSETRALLYRVLQRNEKYDKITSLDATSFCSTPRRLVTCTSFNPSYSAHVARTLKILANEHPYLRTLNHHPEGC
ncbi:hypothetical protein AMATHDRAFT_64507 [Amanita thiersii Skay4041]|uniref:Uncharacterized protein n=1 Tax=Amanita thiersii Skay4041 TaxID=703135 RepID=A0A2A9NMB6_9AGAR|nr:hypothetical protein AMATHDRAFT_64507 [Amanita thiersii Skay4041]